MKFRALAALALALSLSCAPIYAPEGCPKPCPLSCANSCLPTGYCESQSWSPTASPQVVRDSGAALNVALGDLPPDVTVALTIHSVVDIEGRDGTTPWDYLVELSLDGPTGDIDVLNASAFNSIDFPIVGDWSGAAQTDASGTLALPLVVNQCAGRVGRPGTIGCLIFLPAFQITATVTNPDAWEEAPACP